MSPKKPTREELAGLYLKRKLSIHQIAEVTGFSRRSVARWIAKDGVIPLRTRDENRELLRKHPLPDKNTLFQLYWAGRLSLSQIGQKLGASEFWVWKLMKTYGIPRRTSAEAGIEFPKAQFSGDPIERAYLIGFRTGDLHSTLDGSQVRIGTTTTHPAMWDLVSSSFGKYGRVSRTPSKHLDGFQWSIFGYLDKSFGFLLNKPVRIPKEILTSQTLFLNFLSGYVDAEGNLRVFSDEDQTAVSFRINSEDEGVLRDIRHALASIGYHVYFELGREKGTKNGKTYRKPMWALGMFRKHEVIDLVKRLSLRHSEKREWAQLVLSAGAMPWHSMEPLVAAHKARIRLSVLEFVNDAARQYHANHEAKQN